jgi:hypothetical protein
MCSPIALVAASIGASAAAARNSAKAQQQSLLYDSKVADNNAIIADNNKQLSEWEALDAMRQGYLDVQANQMQTAAVKSSQKAALAANGIDINEGSANDILSTTDWVSAVDQQTIRDNALRTAWGYRTQVLDYGNRAAATRDSANNLRGGAASISPNAAAGTTLLSGAGQVGSMWYMMNKTGA